MVVALKYNSFFSVSNIHIEIGSSLQHENDGVFAAFGLAPSQ
jgi:hypothetical protein